MQYGAEGASSAKQTRDEVVQFLGGAGFFLIEECLDSTAGANGHRIRSRGGILSRHCWRFAPRTANANFSS